MNGVYIHEKQLKFKSLYMQGRQRRRGGQEAAALSDLFQEG